MDKTKAYLNKLNTQVSIFIDGKWHLFTRNDTIVKDQVYQNLNYHSKGMDDFEMNLKRGWIDEKQDNNRDDHEGTIRHFQ